MDAYLDDHLSIARECIRIYGSSEHIIRVINFKMNEYNSDANKNWIYLDKMLSHLTLIKENIYALRERK